MTENNLESVTKSLKPIELTRLPENPLVSVLVTNYNYAPYIGESIESVLNQTYPYFELVICDDGSTDNSVEVIERYIKRDDRIRLVRKENGGQTSATVAAYEASKGEILCLLDADDAMYLDKLEKVVNAYKSNPAVGCCLHQMLPVSKTGEPISKPLPDDLEAGWLGPQVLGNGLFGTALSTSGVSLRRQVAECVFPLPPEFLQIYYKRGAPTDMYMLGVARLITEVNVLPEVLVKYRFHGTNDGSALTPTVKSVTQILEHTHTVYGFLYQFVEKYYGKTIADSVHLEDSESYWEHLLGLYVLQHKPQNGIRGYSVDVVLTHVPASRRKTIWKIILALPPFLGEQAFKAWWGFSPWKKIFRPVWRLLRVK